MAEEAAAAEAGLAEEARPLLEERARRPNDDDAARASRSNLAGIQACMMVCLALHFGFVAARLELKRVAKWPLYIDFIPLFLFALLGYLAAADFAATRIAAESTLGKAVVLVSGFLCAVAWLLQATFLFLRIELVIRWSWLAVMWPFWCMLAVVQLFLCFLIPGFLKANLLGEFIALFCVVWLVSFSVLLASLKLDGELAALGWWGVFAPSWLALPLHAGLLAKRKDPAGACCVLFLLLSGLAMPMRLDGHIQGSWAACLAPIIIVCFASVLQVCFAAGSPVKGEDA